MSTCRKRYKRHSETKSEEVITCTIDQIIKQLSPKEKPHTTHHYESELDTFHMSCVPILLYYDICSNIHHLQLRRCKRNLGQLQVFFFFFTSYLFFINNETISFFYVLMNVIKQTLQIIYKERLFLFVFCNDSGDTNTLRTKTDALLQNKVMLN